MGRRGRGTSVTVVGEKELRDLARDLRRVGGKESVDRLRTELRGVVQPLVPRVQAAIMSMPSKGQNARRGKPSTRMQMAKAVTTQVRLAGRSPLVGVYVSPRKMPNGKRGLPGYFEQVPGKTRLQHPTFGRKPVVQQHVPPAGYFTRSVAGADRAAQRAARRVIDHAAREIENG